MAEPKVMIVEDDRIVAEGLLETVRDAGYGVAAMVFTGEEAVNMAEERRPDLVLMDVVL